MLRPGVHAVRTSSIAVTAALALVAGLTGCTSAGTTASSAAPSVAVTATPTPGSGDVVALAKAFSATLSSTQRAALNQDYTFANASDWSNFPNALLAGRAGGFGGGNAPSGAPTGGLGGGNAPSGAPTGGFGGSGAPTGAAGGAGSSSSTGRVGLQTKSLTANQVKALDDLLAAATGSAENEGYDEVLQHLDADDYLSENGGGDDYGRGNFFIAFLGTPSASGTWELQFGGHHLAVANTYKDGALAGATPSFRGIEPFTTVTVDGTAVQPEQQEQEAFSALLTSLSASQRSAAKLTGSFNDILLGPGKDWAFPTTSEGIAGSELSSDQKALLMTAIEKYVGDLDDADAATILAEYKRELDDTRIAYTGTTGVKTIGDYVRIDGPHVWIEFSMQHGIVLQGAHPHAVWRDKATDYAGLKS